MEFIPRLFARPPNSARPPAPASPGEAAAPRPLDDYFDRRLAEWEDALGPDAAND